MFSVFDCIILTIGVLLTVFWLFLFIKGLKYKEMIDPITEKDFPLREIYGVGFAFMDLIKYKYNSKSDFRLKNEIEILYGGPKYAQYYLRVIYAQRVAISFTLLVLAFAMYGIAGGDITVVIVLAAMAGVLYYYFGTVTKRKITSKGEILLSEFANVVSKLALLTNAGMILNEAWRQVAESGEGEIYNEMKEVCAEMDNGVSEIDALKNFGTRCVIPEIKKFSSTIIQGLSKGNAELVFELQKQSEEIWMIKKQNARRLGEVAAGKLLIPIMLMFIGILIIVIVPVFANLGM